MAITVSGYTNDTATGGGTWLDYGGGGGSGANTDVFLSSTGSRARKVSNGIKGFAFDLGASGTDISGDVVAVRWLVTGGIGLLDTLANSGVVLRVQDTSGNYSDWAIDGSDTYAGGWKVSTVSMSKTPTSNSGTAATLTAARYIGIVWDMTAGVGGGDPNCYIDMISRWPDAGLTISGNSTALVADLQAWDDATSPAPALKGVFETIAGFTRSNAPLILTPDASGFISTGERLVFRDPTYYDGTNTDSALSAQGITSSDADSINFTRMLLLAWATPGVTTSKPRSLDFSSAGDFNLDTCLVYGFDDTVAIELGGTGNTCSFTSFFNCGQISDTGCVISDCDFYNTTDADGAYLWTTSTDMVDCRFFSDGTGHGIDMASAPTDPSTTDFDNIVAVSYGANDTANAFVDNNTGHDVLIASLNGSTGITVNTTTNTTVQASVNVVFNGIVSGSRLYIEAAETVGSVTIGDELLNVQVNTDPYTYVHSYEGELDVTYNVRNASPPPPYYKAAGGTGTISALGVSFNIQQVLDE